MKNNNLYISPMQARTIALDEANVKNAEFNYQKISTTGDEKIYRLDFNTDYMDYCCYVDAKNGEVLGFDCCPSAA
ncbi:MAG: hypothetical protein GX684_02330 [Ruminococcaceae bacterium]|nr:hypothetical protein [Oscillospiraceae bacterium]